MGWLTWGGEAGQSRVKVGIDVDAVPNADASQYYLKVHFYAQAALSINDSVYLNISGSGGNFQTGRIQMANTGVYHFHTIDHGWQGASFAGGPSYSWGVSLGDYYSSPAPSHTVEWTLPAKPGAVPVAANLYAPSNITSSNVRIAINVTADNGSPLNLFGFQWADNAAFNNAGYREHNGHILDIGGLKRATTYWFRGRARNGHGWSNFTPAVTAKTLALAPSAPSNVRVSNIAADTATVAWTDGDNGGSAVTSYGVQVATNSAFTQNARLLPNGSLTGLTPGTTHWVRVRAGNAVGTGGWSTAAQFTTVSGAAVKVNGAWRMGKAYVKHNGQWVPAKVWKKRNGAWVL